MNGLMPATSPTLNDAMKNYSIVRTSWQENEQALRNVRDAVFVREQHVPEDMEWDGYDDDAVHFLALDENNHAVGCVRLLNSGQISRLCVLEPLRHHGIGKQLLDAAEQEARRLGMREVFLHAQTQACAFYEAAGFMANGGIFVEAGIPHRQMIKEFGYA